MISIQSKVVAVKEQVSSDLTGEVVILHPKSGKYFSLDKVGRRIWSLIQEPRPLHEVREVLTREYEVEAEDCERDLLAFVNELASAGLIEVKHGEDT